jgi:hypothetical protein
VALWKTKPYYLSVTNQRVEFFQLIARLIHYLGSGKPEIRNLQKEIVDSLYQVSFLPLSCTNFYKIRPRSPSPEDEIMLDSITVESPPQLGPWEIDPDDQIYPFPMR